MIDPQDTDEVATMALMRSSFISLPKNQDIFRVIFDNTYQFTGLLDARGVALEVNQAALAFAGVAREQVVSKPV